MTLPDWLLSSVRVQIQTLCEQFQAMLGGELVGIYLHGSLAMRCFNPARSDVDILVVTRRQMSVEVKRELIALLLRISNAPFPIEISFVVLGGIHPFAHPLPYDLHYSESWREQYTREMADGSWQEWNKEQRHDPDLTAHLTIIHQYGIVLYGEPVAQVFPPVPAKDYVLAILGDYRDAREGYMDNPVYFVLNACRVYACLAKGRVCSKEEGGVYGLETLPEPFHPLILQALEIYRGTQPETPFVENELAAFAAFMDRSLLNERPG